MVRRRNAIKLTRDGCTNRGYDFRASWVYSSSSRYRSGGEFILRHPHTRVRATRSIGQRALAVRSSVHFILATNFVASFTAFFLYSIGVFSHVSGARVD